MSNNIDLLTICLEDSLFAALYDALCNLETKWHTSSPVDMWIEALSARQKLSKSRRPDLLLRQLFVGLNPNEAVVAKAILMWILFNEDRSTGKSPLKDALARMLLEHHETWNVVYSEFRKSESRNEQMGYEITQTDNAKKYLKTATWHMKWFLMLWKVIIFKCAMLSITFSLTLTIKKDIPTKMRSDGLPTRQTRWKKPTMNLAR